MKDPKDYDLLTTRIFAPMNFSPAVLFLFVVALASQLACKKPANDGIPAYVQIDSVQVVTTPDQGSASHNISNVWLDVNGVNLGVYNPPAILPILETGPTRLFFFAGVKENGISATRVIYPFFEPDTITIDLQKEEIDTFNPSFRYTASADFYIYNFDNGNGFENMGRTDSADLVFEGAGSGMITLDEINNSVVCRLIDGIRDLPLGTPVFIEMNYRNNNQFYFGVSATDENGTTISLDKLIITPKEEWNKIYINVGPEITQFNTQNQTPIREYNFIIRAVKSDNVSIARIFIDNFKIVY